MCAGTLCVCLCKHVKCRNQRRTLGVYSSGTVYLIHLFIYLFICFEIGCLVAWNSPSSVSCLASEQGFTCLHLYKVVMIHTHCHIYFFFSYFFSEAQTQSLVLSWQVCDLLKNLRFGAVRYVFSFTDAMNGKRCLLIFVGYFHI